MEIITFNHIFLKEAHIPLLLIQPPISLVWDKDKKANWCKICPNLFFARTENSILKMEYSQIHLISIGG